MLVWCACRRVHYFSHETTSGLYSVVSAAEADGHVAGYVLDLRNDPGGVFEEAVAMAALFEVIVSFHGVVAGADVQLAVPVQAVC